MSLRRQDDQQTLSFANTGTTDVLREMVAHGVFRDYEEPSDCFAVHRNRLMTSGVLNYVTMPYAPATTGDARSKAEIRTIGSIRLERALVEERKNADIDLDSRVHADSALQDALDVNRRYNLSGVDNMFFSDDGVLTLQWDKGAHGAALVFTGEKKVSASTAGPNKLYSQGIVRLRSADPLPADFLNFLRQF